MVFLKLQDWISCQHIKCSEISHAGGSLSPSEAPGPQSFTAALSGFGCSEVSPVAGLTTFPPSPVYAPARTPKVCEWGHHDGTYALCHPGILEACFIFEFECEGFAESSSI